MSETDFDSEKFGKRKSRIMPVTGEEGSYIIPLNSVVLDFEALEAIKGVLGEADWEFNTRGNDLMVTSLKGEVDFDSLKDKIRTAIGKDYDVE